MSEMIMVVDSNTVNSAFGEDSEKIIRTTEAEFTKTIEKYCFIPRDEAETDMTYRQIISYCLIVCGDDIFVTRRTKKQTEARLHNRHSVGIGGHISLIDCSSDSIVNQGMNRELLEEVDIQSPYTCDFFGIINDNSSEVSLVHTGVCYIIRLEEKKCTVKETDKMEGVWVNRTEIDSHWEYMENWSKILLNSYLERL